MHQTMEGALQVGAGADAGAHWDSAAEAVGKNATYDKGKPKLR